MVILAAFPDRPLTHEREYFVGTPTSLMDRVVVHFAAASSNRLRIIPTLGRQTVVLPLPRARYVQRPDGIARDAITAFAAVADDADRTAIAAAHAVIVFFAGAGRESHVDGGDPNDPWSNYTEFNPPALGFGEACVIAEQEMAPFSNFGVLCHELGHLLGLPELYAPGGRPNEGIGKWGLMGQGTWLGKGETPPGMDAWSRTKLGWADVVQIDRTTAAVEIPPVGEIPRVIRIPAVPDKPQEYYLLEYRRRTGIDAALPAEGLLVWHVDETVGGFRDAQVNEQHKMLHLVEMDGRNDLDRGHTRGGNRGDATDPWVGPPRWRPRVSWLLTVLGAGLIALAVFRLGRAGAVFGAVVRLLIGLAALACGRTVSPPQVIGPGTPGMSPYGGEPVRVVIRNVSPLGPTMQADILVAPDLAGVEPLKPVLEPEPGAR